MPFAKMLLVTLVLAASGAVLAQEAVTPSVDEIVEKTNQTAYYQGDDGRARVVMEITDAQDRVRTKEFTILRRNQPEPVGDQKFYVYFQLPADERGTVFMVWKHVGADDDRWLYLPALDVTKRIAASDERTSFVGSHFFYEDVSGRGTDEDTHELVEVTDAYYVLKNTPKKPELVEFDSFTIYVHKETFVPVKIEYEDGGEVYRTVTAEKVEDIQGFKTVTKSRVEDKKIGGHTVMEYKSVEYNVGLPEDVFTERFLRRAPREHLQS
jgi:outer membrane lipoprotein-sorting protein